MLEVDSQGTAEVFPEPDPCARVGEPGEVEILTLGPLDFVPLAVEPADPTSGCKEQASAPLLVPPLKGSRGRGPNEMMLRATDDGFAQEAEPIAENQGPSKERPWDPEQGAFNAELLWEDGIAERRCRTGEAPEKAAFIIGFPMLGGVVGGDQVCVGLSECLRDEAQYHAKPQEPAGIHSRVIRSP